MTTRTFEIPEHPSPQLKTVLHYLDSVKVFDLAAIANLFADDDFVQSTRPLSLNVPSRTKEEDLAFLGGFSERLQGRHLEVGCGVTVTALFIRFNSIRIPPRRNRPRLAYADNPSSSGFVNELLLSDLTQD